MSDETQTAPGGWRARLGEVIASLQPLLDRASSMLDADRLSVWLPMALTGQRLFMTLGEVVMGWRELAARGEWGELNASFDEARERLLAEGQALLDSAPEASEFILGVETLDALMTRVMANEEGRVMAWALVEQLEQRADRLVGRLITRIFTPRSRDELEEMTHRLEALDALFQRVLEELILPRLFADQWQREDDWRAHQGARDDEEE